MNETIKNILERRSIRSYETTQVKDEDLELIVQCGLYAATGMGKQPWHFTVLQNRELMDKKPQPTVCYYLMHLWKL